MMRVRVSHLTIASAVLLLTAATTSPVERMTLANGSRLWFDGTSTLRSWTCTADKIESKIDAESGVANAVLDGRKVAGTLEVEFPVEKLECKNGTMNEHMRKAIKAKEFPTIAFKVASYALARATDGMDLTLTGTLSLGGVEKPITVAARVKGGDDGRLLVTGSHEVRMKEFGLKPPTLMLGTMRVDQKITVAFEIALKD